MPGEPAGHDSEPYPLGLPRQLVEIVELDDPIVVPGIHRRVRGEKDRVVGLRANDPNRARRSLVPGAHLHAFEGLKQGEETDGWTARCSLQYDPSVLLAAQAFGRIKDVAVGSPENHEVHKLLRAIAMRADHHRQCLVIGVPIADVLNAAGPDQRVEKQRKAASRRVEVKVAIGSLPKVVAQLVVRSECRRLQATKLRCIKRHRACRTWHQQHGLALVTDIVKHDLANRINQSLLPSVLVDRKHAVWRAVRLRQEHMYHESLDGGQDATRPAFHLL
mmetsp:Transcript_64706/g.187540  ORF Transcript_64706/g.187540 Transcript_64706/m.187540 type:complete len:276 (+) Transcript_64706:352-1179(+)